MDAAERMQVKAGARDGKAHKAQRGMRVTGRSFQHTMNAITKRAAKAVGK